MSHSSQDPKAKQQSELTRSKKQYRAKHNSDTERKNLRKSNRKATLWLCVCVLAMFGFGFALVPLYDVMCDALGINGKTNSKAVSEPQLMRVDKSRLVKVEFMTHINPDMPWDFKPQKNTIEVHPGEIVKTAYIAQSLTAQHTVGQAVPSVSPGIAASHFNKIECFCFNKQPLSAGDNVEMPLIFYIEPDLPKTVTTLTLSYTLFNITPEPPQPETKINTAQVVPLRSVMPENTAQNTIKGHLYEQ